jgi:hypothetical protein
LLFLACPISDTFSSLLLSDPNFQRVNLPPTHRQSTMAPVARRRSFAQRPESLVQVSLQETRPLLRIQSPYQVSLGQEAKRHSHARQHEHPHLDMALCPRCMLQHLGTLALETS